MVYNDEAVEALLNRDQEDVVEDKDAAQDKDAAFMGMNEYLRSFKVASYQLKAGAEVSLRHSLQLSPLITIRPGGGGGLSPGRKWGRGGGKAGAEVSPGRR